MCHRRTNKESVLSADVGPPETNIIYRSKCNMSIYIIIGGVVPGHYQHKHCHYCSNNHYSIPSVTYVYLYILDVE